MQELNGSVLREPVLVDYARLLGVAAIWGSTFLCNEIALDQFSPLAITAYRVLLAALVLGFICYLRDMFVPLDRRTILLLASIGILNTVVPFTLIGWGQLSIDSATTGILLASSPFVTLLLSHFMTNDDRFTWNKLLGLILGFSGVCVLLGQGLTQGSGTFTGMMAVVLAGSCYALSSLLIRRLGSLPSLVLAAGSLVAGSLIMLPLLLWLDPPWQQAYAGRSLSAIVFLGLGPTALCYVLRNQIVKLNGAVFMSNVGYLIPIFAVFWGWLLLSQQPTQVMLLALGLILAGIAMGRKR